MSNFYIVSTPIGNMGDITLRAIETLKNVDLILCEDTRVTKKLLDKYQIKTPTMSYHAQSKPAHLYSDGSKNAPLAQSKYKCAGKLSKTDKIFLFLKEGKNLALVSDAGTPTISDPGAMLISQIKTYFNNDVRVIPIPGVTAIITALSACGLPVHEFTFLGFLPHKKGRETLFKEITEARRTMIFYESPHRILKTLESLQKYIPNRKVCIARELTKIYEEFKIGNPEELLNYFNKNKEKQRGEFVVIIAP